jgi:hypothetical protein
MFKILIFFLGLYSCSSFNIKDDSAKCDFGEDQLYGGINALLNKKILEVNNSDTLFLNIYKQVGYNLDNKPLEKLRFNSKDLIVNTKGYGYPKLFVQRINDSIKKENRKLIRFELHKEGGVRVKGDLAYDCVEGKLIYVDCYYYSSVK